jgi:hypothetical protein
MIVEHQTDLLVRWIHGVQSLQERDKVGAGMRVPHDFGDRADSPVMPTSRTAPLSEVPAASYDSA